MNSEFKMKTMIVKSDYILEERLTMKGEKFVNLEAVLIFIFCLLSILGTPEIGRADSHDVHFTAAWGPALGVICTTCHSMHSDPPMNQDACITCHSPDGIYDGMNDPDIGAMNNWWSGSGSAIYESDGSLKPGKEKWCLGCHDDGGCEVQGVSAPNVAGQLVSGDWEIPYSIISSDMPGAENLVDNNLGTGNTGVGTYIIFDLGDSANLSHLKLYTMLNSDTRWEVYGGNDLVNWTRVLFGQSVIFAAPVWQAGPSNGWNEIRVDRFIPVRYIKLVKISPWPLGNNSLCEVGFKKDLQYGYYVNGHKISCDNCHDTAGAHCDGIARTYKASLDNYQSGYRLKFVNVGGEDVSPLEIPRAGCNSGENPRTSNDFALCFSCHDKYKLLGDAYGSGEFSQYPLLTNFRNDDHLDENGKVSNEHLRHLRGRFYCGSGTDWDSDWDGTLDSPQSCPACHNVHGSPSPAMIRHGELSSLPGTADKVPMFNLRYINVEGKVDSDLLNVMDSIGGQTQFYGPGPGWVGKNHTCNMCHNDQVIYHRTPLDLGTP